MATPALPPACATVPVSASNPTVAVLPNYAAPSMRNPKTTVELWPRATCADPLTMSANEWNDGAGHQSGPRLCINATNYPLWIYMSAAVNEQDTRRPLFAAFGWPSPMEGVPMAPAALQPGSAVYLANDLTTLMVSVAPYSLVGIPGQSSIVTNNATVPASQSSGRTYQVEGPGSGMPDAVLVGIPADNGASAISVTYSVDTVALGQNPGTRENLRACPGMQSGMRLLVQNGGPDVGTAAANIGQPQDVVVLLVPDDASSPVLLSRCASGGENAKSSTDACSGVCEPGVPMIQAIWPANDAAQASDWYASVTGDGIAEAPALLWGEGPVLPPSVGFGSSPAPPPAGVVVRTTDGASGNAVMFALEAGAIAAASAQDGNTMGPNGEVDITFFPVTRPLGALALITPSTVAQSSPDAISALCGVDGMDGCFTTVDGHSAPHCIGIGSSAEVLQVCPASCGAYRNEGAGVTPAVSNACDAIVAQYCSPSGPHANSIECACVNRATTDQTMFWNSQSYTYAGMRAALQSVGNQWGTTGDVPGYCWWPYCTRADTTSSTTLLSSTELDAFQGGNGKGGCPGVPEKITACFLGVSGFSPTGNSTLTESCNINGPAAGPGSGGGGGGGGGSSPPPGSNPLCPPVGGPPPPAPTLPSWLLYAVIGGGVVAILLACIAVHFAGKPRRPAIK